MVRYNKPNFRSPLEDASKRARKAEIERLEEQRDRLKAGFALESDTVIRMRNLELKKLKGWGYLK